MRRHFIDRITDTTGFRQLLATTAVLIVPVMILGIFVLPLFALTCAAFVLAGVGWLQRRVRLRAERTGRAVDVVPTMLLSVAIGLAVGAAMMSILML